MTWEDHRITEYAWQVKETSMNHFLHRLAKRTENFRHLNIGIKLIMLSKTFW
jgi:hypothetical protein